MENDIAHELSIKSRSDILDGYLPRGILSAVALAVGSRTKSTSVAAAKVAIETPLATTIVRISNMVMEQQHPFEL